MYSVKYGFTALVHGIKNVFEGGEQRVDCPILDLTVVCRHFEFRVFGVLGAVRFYDCVLCDNYVVKTHELPNFGFFYEIKFGCL